MFRAWNRRRLEISTPQVVESAQGISFGADGRGVSLRSIQKHQPIFGAQGFLQGLCMTSGVSLSK
jgi:hypothetical protein